MKKLFSIFLIAGFIITSCSKPKIAEIPQETVPNVSRELLDLIKVPAFQHRVELQNGTVVTGDLLEESDSTLTLKTQIGTLVIKKEMVVRMDELEKPKKPKISSTDNLPVKSKKWNPSRLFPDKLKKE